MNIKPQRVRAIGPGTKAMLLGIVVFAIYSTWERPSTPSARFFEADQSGRLVEVDSPRRKASTVPPLWKPEPDLLLKSQSRLRLRSHQSKSILQLSSLWNAEKSRLQSQLATFDVKSDGSKVALASLRMSMAEYSELSRQFDHARNQSWSAALEVLDSGQRSELEKIRKGGNL